MIESLETICEAAMALPDEQRETLFTALAGSLVPEIGPGRGREILCELDRRVSVPGVPFDADWRDRVALMSDERVRREGHA